MRNSPTSSSCIRTQSPLTGRWDGSTLSAVATGSSGLDDDEDGVGQLIRELKCLVGSSQVTHCWVTRKWLWPDVTTVLDEPPGSLTINYDSCRTTRGCSRFRGSHRPIEAVGPHRFVEAPIYHGPPPQLGRHAPCQGAPLRECRTRAAGCWTPGERGVLPSGGPPKRAPAPVTDEDSETIRRLLALDPWPKRRRLRPTVRTATRAEIDNHWHGASRGDDLYRARLSVPDELDAFSVGELRGVTIHVENRGYPASGTHGSLGWPVIRLTYRWLDGTGRVVVPRGFRTTLPEPLGTEHILLTCCLFMYLLRNVRAYTCSRSRSCMNTSVDSAVTLRDGRGPAGTATSDHGR